MIGVRLSISRYSRSDGTVSGRNGTLSRLFFSFFSFSRFVARLSLIVLWLFIHLFFYRFILSGLMLGYTPVTDPSCVFVLQNELQAVQALNLVQCFRQGHKSCVFLSSPNSFGGR